MPTTNQNAYARQAIIVSTVAAAEYSARENRRQDELHKNRQHCFMAKSKPRNTYNDPIGLFASYGYAVLARR
jgi:hypothetical protein